MIVTCVTHHPGRPVECLLRAVRSLAGATKGFHEIDLYVQGAPAGGTIQAVWDIVTPVRELALRVTVFPENTGQVRPLILSVERAKALDASWWAKLDDDGELPPLAWDNMIEALEDSPAAACAQASPRSEPMPKILADTPAGIRVKDGYLATGENEHASWHVVECVGDGCTVFRREVFEVCHWDERFEVSADIDMAMQFRQAGFVSLLCDPPQAGHFHQECTPDTYGMERHDHEKVLRTKEAFFDKWGQPCCYFNKLKRRYPPCSPE